jgi:IS30 family transposase
MGSKYSHLTELHRVAIESGLREGLKQAEIARRLGVNRSSICREVRRGTREGQHAYMAFFGQQAYDLGRRSAGRARRKLGDDTSSPAWQYVIDGLRARRSPEQIAGRDAHTDPLEGLLPPPAHRVSHETIYCAIYALPRGALKTELKSLLRRSRGGRRRSRSTPRSGPLQDITSIAVRPAEVADRTVPGHWEGDFLKGAGNRSAIGTLVERTSRYTILARMSSCSALAALEGFTRRFSRIPEPLRKTLTYDQGSEMALHKQLARKLNIQVFFCDPYRPGQRGTNENTNGLLREFLPKGLDLSPFTNDDLASLEFVINNRPRRVLGYRTPQEVFDELCAQHAKATPQRPQRRH